MTTGSQHDLPGHGAGAREGVSVVVTATAGRLGTVVTERRSPGGGRGVGGGDVTSHDLNTASHDSLTPTSC